MSTESAVQFPTPTRVHIGLAVRNVERAIPFYRALLGQEPTKERPGYAKFEVLDPPLNLSLNEHAQASASPTPQHFGIQVQQHATIDAIARRMNTAGFGDQAEQQVTCCYAVQDKRWVADPDGHQWELFIVTDADAPVHSRGDVGPRQATPSADDAEPSPCCAPSCCS